MPTTKEHYVFEMTDTFGGEANYSWVRKYDVTVSNTSRLALVRRAKKLFNLTYLVCIVSDDGETITIRPRGCNTIVFIFPHYEQDANNE